MLSKRLPEDLSDSPFFCKLSAVKKLRPYADLTVCSPILTGIEPDLGSAAQATLPEWGTWKPSAAGRLPVREAVARYYALRSADFNADEIILTAGTSEAYSILFKTFCDAGDTILTPVPGYPLLDALAGLEYLHAYPYFLKRMGDHWALDADSLESAPENSKILLLVSPHNPTGHCVSEREWNAAVDFCARRGMALVVDEVFGDYVYDASLRRPASFDSKGVPVFFLNGLSKTVGSPELKLGWIAYHGGKNAERIREALEYVADAYLSVSSVAQEVAVPLLGSSFDYQRRVQKRLENNLKTLYATFPEGVEIPRVQGGWYAALHFEGADDEELTLRLLEKAQVLVQPGFFFDFDEDGWVVMSLLAEESVFNAGIVKIAEITARR